MQNDNPFPHAQVPPAIEIHRKIAAVLKTGQYDINDALSALVMVQAELIFAFWPDAERPRTLRAMDTTLRAHVREMANMAAEAGIKIPTHRGGNA